MSMHPSGPSPFSREGSRPEDGLGATRWPSPPLEDTPPIDPWSNEPAPAYAPQAEPLPSAYPVDTRYAWAPPGPPVPSSAPPVHWPAYASQPPRRNSPYAVASLIAGLLGLFVIVTGPLALGLGIAGLRQTQTHPGTHEGQGLAIGGIVTGAIGTLMLVLLALALGA